MKVLEALYFKSKEMNGLLWVVIGFKAVADPGGAAGVHLPAQRDPLLSFSHMFLPKSAHVRGRRTAQREIPDPQLQRCCTLAALPLPGPHLVSICT